MAMKLSHSILSQI